MPDETDAGGRDRSARDGEPADKGDGARGSAGLTDRQSWLVVGVVALCFVGFPALVLVWPPGFLGFRDAYLAFAMLPGLLLGAVGVWAALRAGRG